MKQYLIDYVDLKKSTGRNALIYYETEDVVTHQSYEELADITNSICQALSEKVINAGQVAAIIIGNHLIVPGVILGILKVRAAFLYIDIEYPVKRIEECLLSGSVNFIITDQDPLLPGWKMLKLVPKISDLKIYERFNPEAEMTTPSFCKELAYVIHTSGSTGTPKAVFVQHQCIIPNILDLREEYRLTVDDIIFISSPFTFDPSVVDLFLALSSGARLVMVHPSIKLQPLKLARILHKEKVSIVQATPSLLLQMSPSTIRDYLLCPAPNGLRILILGGEPFPPLKTLRESRSLGNATIFYNIYGITEVSCWASLKIVDLNQSDQDIDLGRPLSGTLLRVVDNKGEEITEGEGSLLIGGPRIGPNRSNIDTGDRVELLNGRIYYRGRFDNGVTVKRLGKRLNLHSVELIALESGLVRQCSAFIHQNLLILAAAFFTSGSVSTLKEYFALNAINYERPDEVIHVDVLPVTRHGKVDRSQLLDFILNQRLKQREQHKDWLAVLIEEWNMAIGNPHQSIQEDVNFIANGGNSILAVQLSSRLESRLGRCLPNLIDMLLNRSFGDVKRYIQLESMQVEVTIQELPMAVYQRCRPSNNIGQPSKVFNLSLKLDWTYDLKKCIDASPLVVQRKTGTCVYIGSHSHLFASLDLETGKELWSVELPDRIESSASCDPSGSQILIGCYDGCLYNLNSSNGSIRWKWPTNDAVKSSPVCTDGGTVIFGSHDRNLYCLKTEDGSLIWSTSFSSGSLFSSPAWHPKTNRILAASLDGTCASLDASNGATLWSIRLAKPVFSSPIWMDEDRGLFASVDGTVHCLSSGHSLWAFQAAGPIFSSLNLGPNGEVLFGSHDHSVYCLDGQSGAQLWRSELSAPVYSSPFLDGVGRVYCCDTKGSLGVLNLSDGSLLAKTNLDGEVFSSPVVIDNGRLVVGCRNDLIYCFSIL